MSKVVEASSPPSDVLHGRVDRVPDAGRAEHRPDHQHRHDGDDAEGDREQERRLHHRPGVDPGQPQPGPARPAGALRTAGRCGCSSFAAALSRCSSGPRSIGRRCARRRWPRLAVQPAAGAPAVSLGTAAWVAHGRAPWLPGGLAGVDIGAAGTVGRRSSRPGRSVRWPVGPSVIGLTLRRWPSSRRSSRLLHPAPHPTTRRSTSSAVLGSRRPPVASTERATTATASPSLGVTNFTPMVERPVGRKLVVDRAAHDLAVLGDREDLVAVLDDERADQDAAVLVGQRHRLDPDGRRGGCRR